MKLVRIVLAVSAIATLAACTGGDGEAPPSPSSAFPSETGATGPATTGSSGELPTTSPGSATGNLTRGVVSFRLSGDVAAEKTLQNLITAVYAPPPGALAVVWAARGTDASVVGLGGESFTGTRRTTSTLSLSITAQTSQGIASFLSVSGECEVTIDVAEEDEVAGRFSCTGLVSPAGEVVDVTASFRAAG